MILIVCSNWSDTLDSLEILSIRANSPMICFSIKYSKNDGSCWSPYIINSAIDLNASITKSLLASLTT
uniref:Uncharacterized protein n=1 Tax=Arundo donax TaxID=35708 RepID=A0A0A9GJL0_ARUDO